MGNDTNANIIRVYESYDWVMLIILICCALYILMLNWLQRDPSIKNFILQNLENSSNAFLSWMITSLGYCLLLSTLLSQMIPTVPQFIEQYSIAGYTANKFGFTLGAVSLFYFLRSTITCIYFYSVGAGKRWSSFFFSATRFYFILSLALIIANFVHYYYLPSKEQMLTYYIPTLLGITLFKFAFYIFHKNHILPKEWYYKFLYICTLQIAPLLLLWRLLFI